MMMIFPSIARLSADYDMLCLNASVKGTFCIKSRHHHELVRLRSLKTCSVIAPEGVPGLSIFVVVSPSLSFRQVDI
jgi:hypothetical protein